MRLGKWEALRGQPVLGWSHAGCVGAGALPARWEAVDGWAALRDDERAPLLALAAPRHPGTPETAPPAPRLPPPFDYRAAQRALSRLYAAEQTEVLPIGRLRAAAQLPDAQFAALLLRLGEENKLMVSGDVAYLI